MLISTSMRSANSVNPCSDTSCRSAYVSASFCTGPENVNIGRCWIGLSGLESDLCAVLRLGDPRLAEVNSHPLLSPER